jgi:hypothetical protein
MIALVTAISGEYGWWIAGTWLRKSIEARSYLRGDTVGGNVSICDDSVIKPLAKFVVE